MTIQIPKLKKPTLQELKAKYPWIHSIESDSSPEEAVTLELDTVLEARENYISGKEYEKRRKDIPVLGYSQAEWLVEHQDEFPELKAELGKIYVDFPATMGLLGDGYRFFPCLRQDGARWNLHWYWLDDDLNSRGRMARSGKSKPLDSRTLEDSRSLESRISELENKMSKIEKVIRI